MLKPKLVKELFELLDIFLVLCITHILLHPLFQDTFEDVLNEGTFRKIEWMSEWVGEQSTGEKSAVGGRDSSLDTGMDPTSLLLLLTGKISF